MPHRRVVVTGLGVVCGLGTGAEAVWESLREGRSAIRPIESVDMSRIAFKNGAETQGFDPSAHFTPSQIDHYDRFAQFAVYAAREALRDSGIELTDALRERTGIVAGSSLGGQTTEDAGFLDVYNKGKNRVHPLTIPRTMANAGASQISMELGVTGPAFTLSTACSSSNHSLVQALGLLRAGTIDLAIAGGSEAPFSFGLLKAWEAMRVVAPDTCRPFCKDRRGMVLGEGGAMLVLEPLESAKARGAKIYAELAGGGMTSDAHHITQPSVSGPARAIRIALEDGGIAPDEIGYINAHGTATPGNDPAETRAIRAVFGDHADRIAVSSTKSMHGHALGGAGAIEAVATVLALKDGILPPTANFTEADPECDLDYVPNTAREQRVNAALSDSFAFGGLNAVVSFRAFRG
ncbi:MAG TPA: beta-ketoacyl-[acyl-carrier-protein] synthase family protein [Candidatus Acidoferrales bacterium]|nr:beta-ketoacyl-[acyl-carrier-protein] synthase family protein [Candidatus Acidoferrales bacterium]